MATTKTLIDAIKKSGTYTVSAGNHVGEKLYEDNPYRGLTYQRSPWQMILGHLGFRTSADDWLTDKEMQANEWDAGIAQKLNDREYDLPINQVARQRAAGLNPDLDGGSSIGTGEPGTSPDDNSAPAPTESNDVAQFASIITSGVSIIGSAFDGALSMCGAVMDLRGKHLQNSVLANEDSSSLIGAFNSFLESQYNGDDFSSVSEDASPGLVKLFVDLTGRRPSKKQMNAMKTYGRNWLDQLDRRLKNTTDKNALFEAEMTRGVQSFSKYNRDSYGVDPELLHSAYKAQADLWDIQMEYNNKMLAMLKKAGYGEASYKNDYYQTASGTEAALADNTTNVASQYAGVNQIAYENAYSPTQAADAANANNVSAAAAARFSALANQMKSDVAKMLKRHADNLIKTGNWAQRTFGYTMLAGAVKLFATLDTPLSLPSVSKSEKSKITPGKYGDSMSSDSSWSFGW